MDSVWIATHYNPLWDEKDIYAPFSSPEEFEKYVEGTDGSQKWSGQFELTEYKLNESPVGDQRRRYYDKYGKFIEERMV